MNNALAFEEIFLTNLLIVLPEGLDGVHHLSHLVVDDTLQLAVSYSIPIHNDAIRQAVIELQVVFQGTWVKKGSLLLNIQQFYRVQISTVEKCWAENKRNLPVRAIFSPSIISWPLCCRTHFEYHLEEEKKCKMLLNDWIQRLRHL